jgi:two-component system response regulator DevR
MTGCTVGAHHDLAGPQAIRVVVHDHEIVRAGLKAILVSAPAFEVVGEAGPADDPLPILASTQPDVVLLNPRIIAGRGEALCAEITDEHPAVRILIVSTYAEIDLVRACIAAGAHGYVLENSDGLELMRAVRAVHRGELAVTPDDAGRILDDMRLRVRVRTRTADWQFAPARPPGPRLASLPRLTSREQQVLDRLLDGERVGWIAADLFLSESTVRNHLSSIFKKVGVHSQSELIGRLRAAERLPRS